VHAAAGRRGGQLGRPAAGDRTSAHGARRAGGERLAGDRWCSSWWRPAWCRCRSAPGRDERAGRAGRAIPVDDFGTGYTRCPDQGAPRADRQGDRTFVQASAPTRPTSRWPGRSCRWRPMGRYCVAEGVETAEQFHALRGLGGTPTRLAVRQGAGALGVPEHAGGAPLPVPPVSPARPGRPGHPALPTETTSPSRWAVPDGPTRRWLVAVGAVGCSGPRLVPRFRLGQRRQSRPLGGFDAAPDAFATPIADYWPAYCPAGTRPAGAGGQPAQPARAR